MVWCGVVVLVSGSRCDACGVVSAVVMMIYTGDWIVVAADSTVCRQSSWWRNGCLRRMALAFSLCSTRLRDCWICKAHVFSSSPVRADFNLASSLNTLYASPPQPPPSASATRGTKMMPADSHSLCVSIYSRLKSSYCRTAACPSWAAAVRTCGRRPLVTAKSKAAGNPRRQRGT